MDSTSRPRKVLVKLYRQELDRENIELTICVFLTFNLDTDPYIHTQTSFFHMILRPVEGINGLSPVLNQNTLENE